MEREIDVIVSFPNKDEDPEKYVDTLYEAGFVDSTLGVGKKGSIAIHTTWGIDPDDTEKLAETINSLSERILKVVPKGSTITLKLSESHEQNLR